MVSITRREGVDYIHIDAMSLELDVKSVKMMVKKVFNHNRILSKIFFLLKKQFVHCLFFAAEATNLFLRENGHEVLKAMIPQLKRKLSDVFMHIGNQIFDRVPLQQMYLAV